MTDQIPTVYFPDYSVEFGFTFDLGFNTSEVEFSNRRRQARLHDPRVQRALEGRVPVLVWDTSEDIRNFFVARGGNFEAFYIFAWMPQKVTGYIVDPDFGTETEYVIPFKTVTSLIVYDDGVEIDVGALGIATGGETSFFAAGLDPAPASGSVITADVIGRERIPVKLNGRILHAEHPLHRPQDASGPADFYSIPVIEVF